MGIEMELIYCKIDYENARNKMEQHRLNCMKMEEEIQHFKTLSDLQQQKEQLLNKKSEKEYNFLFHPKRI